MDVFFSQCTQADSNQIPAQIPCRHCSVLLERLLLMHECDLIQKTEEKVYNFYFIIWTIPINFWKFLETSHEVTSCKMDFDSGLFKIHMELHNIQSFVEMRKEKHTK